MTEQNSYNDFFADDDEKLSVNESSYGSLPIDARVAGEVLRIVYSNSDNSYSVIKMRSSNPRLADITLVGMLAGLQEGQDIEAEGRWECHPEHGRQFRVQSFKGILPATEKGITRYLASGVLPGVGTVYAERIVKKFGTETLNVLDNYSERLSEIPGIGKKRITEIRKAWHEQNQHRETLIFFQGLGITPAYANRIMNRYSAVGAPQIVRNNPYRLAADIDGIGFLTADRIAGQLGIEKDNPLRLCAGIVHTLEELANRGNVCYPQVLLVHEAIRILDVSEAASQNGLEIALSENKVCAVSFPDPDLASPFIYLRRLKQAEEELAEAVNLLLRTPLAPAAVPWQRLGNDYQRLNEKQKQAVHWALQYGCSLVTGGPGVGKTTVIATLVRAGQLLRLKISLAAPTGRAAKRMTEATGFEASTIHRLLKWEPDQRAFYYGPEHKLPCQLLVVDEISMLDVSLANSLFRAISPGTRLVLVGDKDQLPSVGPGTVLQDFIHCRRIPVTELTEIYRQGEGSRIIVNAHAVNQGHSPDLRPVPTGSQADFYWIEQDEPEKAAELISRMVAERIPNAFGFDPMTEIQVLSPMRKGACGILALNNLLQEVLNPADSVEKPEFIFGNRLFRLGDRVMQTSNNYDKGVFNGEMGRISAMDSTSFSVLFEQGDTHYQQNEADQITLAYAVTVHKSQGSEFPVVVLPVLTQHYVMLQRNLIYTGMTRAKKLLIMIGTRKALEIAIANNTPMRRLSLLDRRLAKL
ncbi:MAG: ATP-dependent RecD-like DNA helicase [Lentisphaeria bacterium]